MKYYSANWITFQIQTDIMIWIGTVKIPDIKQIKDKCCNTQQNIWFAQAVKVYSKLVNSEWKFSGFYSFKNIEDVAGGTCEKF